MVQQILDEGETQGKKEVSLTGRVSPRPPPPRHPAPDQAPTLKSIRSALATELYTGLALVCPGSWTARRRRRLAATVEKERMLAAVRGWSAAGCLVSLLSGSSLLTFSQLRLLAALRLLFYSPPGSPRAQEEQNPPHSVTCRDKAAA